MASAPMPKQGMALTAHEVRILTWISYGKSNGEIGAELLISEDTVKTHNRRIFRKLGATDRAHATRLGLELGYLKVSGTGAADASSATERGPIRDGGYTAACWTGGGCQCPTQEQVA